MPNGRQFFGVTLALTGLYFVGASAFAQQVHLNLPVPGGMPGRPVMTGISRGTNTVTVTWDGPSGYYQLYQKLGLNGQPWLAVGGPNFDLQATVAATSPNACFRVSGPSAMYIGVPACVECHESTVNIEASTPHAQAFQALRQVHQENNPNCLVCHTVGYGLPTGFVNASATPDLAGVQCENCHGPAAKHAANEMDLTVRPRVDIAGQVCGGCHNGPMNPTFDEWKSSGHFAVVEDMNPPDRINSCGRCHSGTARLALVNGQDPAVAAHNDANVGLTCVVCHDPHQMHSWKNVLNGQTTVSTLRYPVASTNYFSLATTAPFQNRYDINVCAQCHNDRGAVWTSNSRAPHQSPQYNMLLGTVGLVITNGVVITNGGANANLLYAAGHAGTRFFTNTANQVLKVTNQCVTCHMQTKGHQAGPPEVAAVTGHSFQVSTYEACLGCHPAQPDVLIKLTTNYFTSRIESVKTQLDMWALTKAPAQLWTNYGTRSWEYTTPGELSPGGPGPTASQQTNLIPPNIRSARFNLYLVLSDGSYGVHNKNYSDTLLDTAELWVQGELNK